MVVLKDGFGRKGHIDNGYVSINDEEDEDLTELKEAGLDPEELKFMDDDDRWEVLEAAGLDTDEFDFKYLYE